MGWRQIVGSNIRSIRRARGLTQESLALQSGVTRNVLIDVEHGKRGLLYERLIDLANALEIDVGELFRDVSPAPPAGPRNRTSDA